MSAPTGYILDFQSKFNTPNYVPIANGWDLLPAYVLDKAWVPQFIGHTPNAQDFGDAYFTPPGDSSGNHSPWWIGWGQLICSPYKDTTGHWRSGIISTADTGGEGFSASLGYWEASFTVPNQSGIWPSFWLNDVMAIPYLNEIHNGNHYEIDVCELYGPNKAVGLESGWQVNQHLHVWAPGGAQVGGADHVYVAPKTWCGTTSGSFQSGSHVYGVLITGASITFFMDGVETFSTPSPKDIATHKFFGMIDYAMGSGYPDPVAPCNPMWIQYLTHYAPPA